MSHYTRVEVEFRDRESLLEALREMYGEGSVQVHNEPVALNNWQDMPTALRAEIVVRHKELQDGSYMNDLGFQFDKSEDKFIVHADSSWAAVGDQLRRLKRSYSEKTTIRTMSRKGFKVSKRVEEGQKVRLVLRRG